MSEEPSMSAQHLAEHYGKAAEEIYATEGTVAPVLLLLDDDGMGLLMHPSRFVREHPGEAAALIVAAIGRLLPVRYCGFIVESFMKSFAREDPVAENIERGMLTDMAETDPAVTTCIATQVWDLKYPAKSHSRLSAVKPDSDPRWPQWEVNDVDGEMEGYVNDVFTRAWASAPVAEHQEPDFIAKALMKVGLVTGAMVMERDD